MNTQQIIEMERDKYKAALLRIDEIFIDGSDTYEDWKAMGELARNALEETRMENLN